MSDGKTGREKRSWRNSLAGDAGKGWKGPETVDFERVTEEQSERSLGILTPGLAKIFSLKQGAL